MAEPILQGTGADQNLSLNTTPAPTGDSLSVTTAPASPSLGVTTAPNGSTLPVGAGALQGTPTTGLLQMNSGVPDSGTMNGTFVPPAVQSPDQTFTFNDGSSYDVGGNLVSNPQSGGNVSGQTADLSPAGLGTANITTDGVTGSTDSNALTNNPVTNSDLNAILTKNYDQQNQLFSQLQDYFNNPITPAMQGAFDQYNKANTALNQDKLNTDNQIAGLEVQPGVQYGVVSAQQNEVARQAQFRQANLGLQQQNALAMLNFQQASQSQRLQAASTLFNANNQNIQTTLDMYTKLAPQSLGNVIIDKDGNAHQPYRNPVTGKVGVMNLGFVGQPQGQYSTGPIGTHYDPLTNAQVPTYGVINSSTGTAQPIAGAPSPTPTSDYTTPLNQGLPASTPGSVEIPATQGTTPQGQQQLAYLNNNPGNLKYVGQQGATMGAGGFAKFASPEAGYQALISQAQLDAGRGMTLGGFINKYAPPKENNTAQYISQASSSLNATSNTPLRNLDINRVASFMAQKESGTKISAGGTAQSSENPLVTQAKQTIGNVFPTLQHAIQSTAFGHNFIDTTQVNVQQAQTAAQLYGKGVIAAFDPATTQNIKSINTTMQGLDNIQGLLSSLPEQAMSIGQINNFFKSKFQTDPSLARLKDAWTVVLPDLQSQVGTQGISRLATGFVTNSDLALLPGVTTPQNVALAMLDQTRQLLGNRENSLFGGPPPPPNPATFNKAVFGSPAANASMSIVNSILQGGH